MKDFTKATTIYYSADSVIYGWNGSAVIHAINILNPKHTLKKRKKPKKEMKSLSVSNPLEHHLKAKEDKQEFIMETTAMFLKANIPIEKGPAVRSWMGKYVRGANDLPTASHLRRNYVRQCGENVKREIKEKLEGKQVILYCDETTDRMGNCVFAVLIGTLQGTITQQLYLGSCSYLDTANSTNCVRAILDTIKELEINYENVFGVCTDSAPYMIKCATTLKTIFGEQFKSFTCWCHKLNNIGEIWQKSLKDLNCVVSSLKSIFRNARKLKRQYKGFLEENHQELENKLFPIPVLTRWASWFKSVCYLSDYLPVIKEFLEVQKDLLSPLALNLSEMLTPEYFSRVCIQARFVADNCMFITEPILEFEGRSYPTAHLLHSRLQTLLSKCDMMTKGQFGDGVTQMLSHLPPIRKDETLQTLKLCGAKAYTKLRKYLDTSPANTLFHEVKIIQALGYLFDPANILSRHTLNFDKLKSSFKLLPFFTAYNGDITCAYNELCTMLKTQAEENAAESNFKIENILLGLMAKDPFREFAKRCLQSLWLPVSNANSERYFSTYSLVVTDRRTTLKTENIVTSCMMQFGDVE